MQFRSLGFTGSLVLLSLAFISCRPPASDAPLTQEAYVWQRAHTGAVAEALHKHASSFDHVVVLAAEVSWTHGRANIVRVPLAVPAVKAASSLGLALRVNAFSGSFSTDSASTRTLVELVASLLADARSTGLQVTELQVDFDAAEKRLADYQHWLAALRPVVAPVRLSFTALPSWLKHRRDFSALAASADNYVLQVHSLARPSSPDDTTPLCDPIAARHAIENAARFGRPFRVALPTYGYRLAFDSQGRFFALSAEGPAPEWPPGSIVRELVADPVELSKLVSDLRLRHPHAMTGIIWYRLPTANDRLNWAWPTLDAVMRGVTPSARPSLEARADATGLVECVVVNTGDATYTGAFAATVNWTGATRLAADALPPFILENETASSQRLTAASLRLPPGSRQPAGWLRLDHAPSSLDVSSSP